MGSKFILNEEKKAEHFKLGEEITRTCYRSYEVTRTKLGPEIIRVNNNGEFDPKHGQYKLRPEVCTDQNASSHWYASLVL